jgi:hypothetical protein
MYFASLFPVFLALLSSYTSLALPVPSDCKCNETPLSAPSLEYIRQVVKARHLTGEECAFLCNPSSQPQQLIVSTNRVSSPPLYDPETPRPLPLFDGPPSTKSASHPASQPSPTTRTAPHASTTSTMAPPVRRTLGSYMLQVTGSVVLLMVMAICVVQVGDMAWIAVRRSV